MIHIEKTGNLVCRKKISAVTEKAEEEEEKIRLEDLGSYLKENSLYANMQSLEKVYTDRCMRTRF